MNPKTHKLELLLTVAVKVTYIEGQPDTATLGPLVVCGSAKAHHESALLAFAEPTMKEVPPAVVPHGWHSELIPAAVKAATELDKLMTPGGER